MSQGNGWQRFTAGLFFAAAEASSYLCDGVTGWAVNRLTNDWQLASKAGLVSYLVYFAIMSSRFGCRPALKKFGFPLAFDAAIVCSGQLECLTAAFGAAAGPMMASALLDAGFYLLVFGPAVARAVAKYARGLAIFPRRVPPSLNPAFADRKPGIF